MRPNEITFSLAVDPTPFFYCPVYGCLQASTVRETQIQMG